MGRKEYVIQNVALYRNLKPITKVKFYNPLFLRDVGDITYLSELDCFAFSLASMSCLWVRRSK